MVLSFDFLLNNVMQNGATEPQSLIESAIAIFDDSAVRKAMSRI